MKIFLSFILATIFIYPNQQSLNEEIETLNIQSQNYILYSIEADEVVAKKNNDIPLAAASINKVLTILTALDYIEEDQLDKPFNIDPKIFDNVAIEAAVAGFYPNQSVTLRDVLYGVMLPSGADAAILLSYKLFDSSDGIVEAMNQKAKAIGMENTQIKNQVGLDDDDQYTTLDDLLLLLKTALDDELFYEIYTSARYTLSQEDVTIFDGILMQVLEYDAPHIIGAKSGYTLAAGRALSSLADDGNLSYILITTQAEGGYYDNNGALEDAVLIYDYMYQTYHNGFVAKKNQEVGTLKVKYHYDLVTLKLPQDLEAILSKNANYDIVIDLNADETLKAPLEIGTKLADYTVTVNGEKTFEGSILSEEEINADYYDQLIIAVPIVLVSTTIILIIVIRKRRKRNV